jgi:hypothetical protein
MQRKSFQIAFLAVLALAGCQPTLPPPTPPPHQGAVVRVGCPAPLAELIRTQSSAWEGRQQARVEVVPDKSDKADVWLLRPDELPALAAGGKLATVPAALRDRGSPFEWGGLLPAYREQLLLLEGTAFALPLLGEAPLCLYRADLFADPERRRKFRAGKGRELRAPLSWEDFSLIAEYFQASSPGGKAPSLPPLPLEQRDLDRLFYTVAASCARRAVRQDEPAGPHHREEVFSFHFDLKTGAPRIAQQGFVEALEVLQRLQKCRPAGAHPRPEQAFLEGKAVLCIADASVLPLVQRSRLRDKVGVCLVPGSNRYFTPQKKVVLKEGVNRVPYLGGAGWLAAVRRPSGQAEVAFDLLADLCGPVRGMQIVLEPRWGGGPTRSDQVLRERWESFDLGGARALALRDAVSGTLLQHGLKNPVLCLRVAEAAAFRDGLDAHLRASLQGGGDARAALGRVEKRWKELVAKRGTGEFLKEYRISLGLLGG